MRLSAKSIAAIAGLSIATAGVIAMPFLSSSFSADPRQPLSRPRWQMPMTWGQGPRHQGDRGPSAMPQSGGHGGQGHHGHMMEMMQVHNEFEFLSLMIPHHEEAIATAQRVLESSDRPEMREFAQDIIDVQTAEIEQMQDWLAEWYPDQDTNLAYTPMMRDLSQLEGDDLDQTFLEDMIMHHMGAVMMAQSLMNQGLVEHQAVQPFAQNIATTQRQEIGQMQTWLQDWYGVSGMPGPMSGGRR